MNFIACRHLYFASSKQLKLNLKLFSKQKQKKPMYPFYNAKLFSILFDSLKADEAAAHTSIKQL